VADLLKLGHALLGVLFVGALVGRFIVLGMAERAATIADMRTLTRAAAPFERMVIGGGMIMLALGVATAIAQGRPFLGPLQGAHVDWLFVSVVLVVVGFALPPLVFVPRGRVFEAALADAVAQDVVTPRLVAAWRDPVVRAAHLVELIAVGIVLALMISKPF
jgi:hypothetical protein